VNVVTGGEAILALRQDGTLDSLREKWFRSST